MIAPRQGLFASLLTVSFALHTFLLVIATTHQLSDHRSSQGSLMTTQLVSESLTELSPPNTVSLALIANRYATNPSVASLRILDAKGNVLATSGAAKTRQGEVYVREALQGEKKLGLVEITLIEPSIGEILRTQWFAILVALFIHGLLFLAYQAVARPSRQEYLTQVNKEARLKHEIQQLTQALEQEKLNANLAIAQAQQQPQVKKEPSSNETSDSLLALNIQFYDPKQLLHSVNQSISEPYFRLCQLFLSKSVELAAQHFAISENNFHFEQRFNENGAILTLSKKTPEAVASLMLAGAVFQLLSNIVYKRYRDSKRFALQTRAALASEMPEMQYSALETAERLVQQLHAKESALYLEDALLTATQQHYELSHLPNPSNVLTRHAYIVKGMSPEQLELVESIRTEILLGKKRSHAAKASVSALPTQTDSESHSPDSPQS